ncbi:DUF6907 domain-containing protein [Streptomyces chitinivorans]|uniref:DUF6907 domain-containing protein n=1 Tax=Streptomyces chitinivorans TaxID=1257027 RepID=A0ABW7HUF3_9ACTN|nr:hypothetical protein [Streptomyces chitinivorans]MDH2407195.1 hypothetical protein [Streptomyces chitinivorans]
MGRTVPTPVNSADEPIPFFLTPKSEALAAPAIPGPRSEAAGRMVQARIGGALVTIPCPTWCVVDHVADDAAFIQDVSHHSLPISLPAPTFGGGQEQTEEILTADVSQWPFSSGHTAEPFVSLDASGDSLCAELAPEALEAFADQLEAHADKLRQLARLAAVARTAGGAR